MTEVAGTPESVGVAVRPGRTFGSLAAAVFRRRSASVGVALLFLVLAAVTIGPHVWPYDPLIPSPLDARQPPTLIHPFGTDELGRDVLARVLHGGWPSLSVALISSAVALVFGTFVGIISGYRLGVMDAIVGRLTDLLLGFPTLVFSLAVLGFLGPGPASIITALTLAAIPWYARVARGQALQARRFAYVEAAILAGASDSYVIRHHVAQSVAPQVIILATVGFGSLVIAAGTLSFLGLGTSPPTPEWGLMVAEGRTWIQLAWWISVMPGLVISLTAVAPSLIADGLRDVADPRRPS